MSEVVKVLEEIVQLHERGGITTGETFAYIDRARTALSRHRQRVSFVYGNLSADSKLTRDEVEKMIEGWG